MRLLKYLLGLTVLVVLIGGGAWWAAPRWRGPQQARWRTATVSQGKIVAIVESTGTIKPVLSVTVGSFVSGPIIELHADFNQVVKKDDVLARVDPRLFDAALKRSEAVLATRQAEVLRARALLEQAIRDERRSLALQQVNEDFIAQKEMDAFHFNRVSLEAQVLLAEAAVRQAEADVENAEANLDYTDIRAPIDGIVIERKIDRGNTLAAQFQAPELFILAPDMDKKMHVFASVDEADIGMIQQAYQERRPVSFNVDAYPDDEFAGEIEQIRRSSTAVQNVVTYPVVVAAPNPDLKLLPGMTASIEFEVDRREDATRIPNAALRFFPQAEQVREQDREILERDYEDEEEAAEQSEDATDRGRRRHVWVVDGELLRAIPIKTGLTDARYTELLEGDLPQGAELVTGERGRDAE